jgi:hypothetical protein
MKMKLDVIKTNKSGAEYVPKKISVLEASVRLQKECRHIEGFVCIASDDDRLYLVTTKNGKARLGKFFGYPLIRYVIEKSPYDNC